MSENKPGMAPYIAPMIAFLVLVEASNRLPEHAALLLVAKLVVPALLFGFFAARGAFPELTRLGGGAGVVALDVLVGLLGAVVWVAPFALMPSLQPKEAGFDPSLLGDAWIGWLVRGLGFVVVTAFVEELFVRSWLQRFVEVWDDPQRDFREIALGNFSTVSAIVVLLYFVFSHAQWEWPVAAAWIVLTQLWFYRRKSLAGMVVVHATSNLAILLLVIFGSGLPFEVRYFV